MIGKRNNQWTPIPEWKVAFAICLLEIFIFMMKRIGLRDIHIMSYMAEMVIFEAYKAKMSRAEAKAMVSDLVDITYDSYYKTRHMR